MKTEFEERSPPFLAGSYGHHSKSYSMICSIISSGLRCSSTPQMRDVTYRTEETHTVQMYKF